MKQVGDTILVKANDVLGTEEVMATITEVYENHYVVVLDGDSDDWSGTVNLDGEVCYAQGS